MLAFRKRLEGSINLAPAHRRIKTSRATTAILAAVTAAMGVYLAASWRELRLRWLCRQMEAAATFAEARVPLESIAVAAKDPAIGREFLARLGPARTRATFWFFSYFLATEDRSGLQGAGTAPKRFEVLGHLSEPFAERLIQEEGLLRMWGEYVHWRWGSSIWTGFDVPGRPFSRATLSTDGIHATVYDRFEYELSSRGSLLDHHEEARILLSCFRAYRAAEAWIVGFDAARFAIYKSPPISSRNIVRVASGEMRILLYRWATERCHRLRFDPQQGRCVLLPPDAPDDPRRFQDRGYPVPAVPFLGWQGPVPAVPELNG